MSLDSGLGSKEEAKNENHLREVTLFSQEEIYFHSLNQKLIWTEHEKYGFMAYLYISKEANNQLIT